jgi:BirA family biotin operon repressor/biotin-[acetyl-CoA-carboxylase] ligase
MTEISEATSALSESQIYRNLSLTARGLIDSVDVFQSIDSTNSYLLKQSFAQGRARLCATEAQPAGRGRRSNTWLSTPHKNVMLSLGWGFSHWPQSLTGLGLAVALVVAERLNQDYKVNAKIKWPNDLLVEGRKLAGVLIDVAGEANNVCNVVIGVGLNVHQPDWSTDDADYSWQDLHRLGVMIDRNQFIANFADDCLVVLREYEEHGFAPLAELWNEYSSYTDKVIRVINNEQTIVGEMRGVNSNGALLVEDQNGQVHVLSDSSVSIRLD